MVPGWGSGVATVSLLQKKAPRVYSSIYVCIINFFFHEDTEAISAEAGFGGEREG